MDSIGSGELFVIAVVVLLAIDPRTAGRWWGKFLRLRDRLMTARADLEHEVGLRLDDEPPPPATPDPQTRLRRWATERVERLGVSEYEQAPDRILQRLRSWPLYQQATAVAAFWSLPGELPMGPVLEGILADGKTLWMPWLGPQKGSMDMAGVSDLDADLVEGRWNTREPREDLRQTAFPLGGVVLVPGSVFDLQGGRIGKGAGFYDRWLARRPDAIPVGLGWDIQVHPGRLPLRGHDIPMQHLLTDNRLVTFRAIEVEPSPIGGESGPSHPMEEDHA